MSSLYWVRRDLRFHDNIAFKLFTDNEQKGLIVWSPTRSTIRAAEFRKSFLLQTLSAFHESLKLKGQQLKVSKTNFVETLGKLLKLQIELHGEILIKNIYYTREFSVEECHEENKLADLAEQFKIKLHAIDQQTLIFENDLPFDLQKMPLVFTSFRKDIEKKLKVLPTIATVDNLPEVFPLSTQEEDLFQDQPFAMQSLNYENSKGFTKYFKAGEDAALNHLQTYLWKKEAVKTYKDTRNGMLNWDDSSKLSIWLNTGSLSPRTIYEDLKKYENQVVQNESTYWLFFELLWRDYFKFLSRKIGSRLFKLNGLKEENHKRYEKRNVIFENWCQGKTGDDFVDAHMRELNQTGWMSNRGRQNVASYLVHNLNLPWTQGAAYFEKMLIDYDPDLNWGNWLYLSGNGTDPRSRMFDTAKQAEMYDKNSEYRKYWLSSTE